LGLACPTGGGRKKLGRVADSYVEEFDRIAIVEEDYAGKRASVAAEDEKEGVVERGEGVPCEGGALGRDGGVLRAGDILPWGVGGIEGGGEGEEEEVIVPRRGVVPISVVLVRFATIDEKCVVDDGDCLCPSEKMR
jgi:hypothetical protein